MLFNFNKKQEKPIEPLKISKWRKNITDSSLLEKSNYGIQSSVSMFNWAMEFTKKIVTITFVIFVITNVFVLCIIFAEYYSMGVVEYLDTLITETHTTFRDVIGGYIIKASMENVSKIGFSVLSQYLEVKYNIKNVETDNTEDTEDGDDSLYDPSDDPMVLRTAADVNDAEDDIINQNCSDSDDDQSDTEVTDESSDEKVNILEVEDDIPEEENK